MKGVCQCRDRECPVHEGYVPCGARAETVLYRVDQADQTGTPMCESCAEAAAESGNFTEEEPIA